MVSHSTTWLALAPLLLPQDPAPPLRDARLDDLVTLDSYHPFSPPESAPAWERRRAALRRQVLVAAGLWPEPPRCDLEPRLHGAIEREGYTVHKVAFQSLPGLWVTGNLYRPDGEGPFAGVLCPHGHWARGRFTVASDAEARASIERGGELHLASARHPLQARCAQLARMGCVVLHYDMIGYADATQLDHRTGFGDVEAELWGMSHFGLQTLASIRALDYLESLPDVDPRRIGVTGASGGGTQTFVLGAVDERPAALFPAVMVSTAMQGGCVCENASHLRVGTGNVEIAALAAPRPLALVGADDWTVEIATRGLPELRALYALLDAPRAVAGWCYPEFPHNYNALSRRHMYEWFAEHLDLDVPRPVVEATLVPVDPEELSVFDEEHPRPAWADLAGVRAAWLRFAREERARYARLAAEDPAEHRRIVGGALAAMTHATLPEPDGVEVAEWSQGSADDLPAAGWLRRAGTRERVRFSETRPQHPEREAARAVVLVVPAGEAAAARASELRAALLASDSTVLAVHPLLCDAGDGALLPVDPDRHATYVGYTWGYNATLFGHRVQDVLTAVAYAQRSSGSPIALVALDGAGPWAIAAAALAGGAVARVAVEGSWDFDRVESLDDPDLLPRALRYGGMEAFAALLGPDALRRGDLLEADGLAWLSR